MSKITIFHNPQCGTSRNVLAAIREAGIEPRIVEYLKTPPDAGEIKALLQKLGARPRDLLRKRGTPYEELGLDDTSLSDEALVAAMALHPILIERPIVVAGTRALLCRPAERVRELL